jgi:hypothetical protein
MDANTHPATSFRQRYFYSLISTSGIALILILLGLWDWGLASFGDQWPVVQAVITQSQGFQEHLRSGELAGMYDSYALDYRYSVDDQSYTGATRFKVSPLSQEQAAARYAVGQTITVWHHPALRGLSFASKINYLYDIVLLCIGGFFALVSIQTLFKIPRSA